jgi:TetR/AcrR family transcriptional regulator, transcriptional repressor for nem operon
MVFMQTEENKRVDTRLKILEKGAEIIHLKGYNHTGIQEILNAAGIPKGSFYNYFKSKEDFGLQVIDFFTDLFPGMIADILESESLTPVEKLDTILVRFIAVFRERDFCYGCPIGNLSQEMGDLSQAFRAKLKNAFDKMAEIYTGLIQKAQSQGEISGDIDAQKAAYFIVTSWHGALGHMKILKSTGPLENHRAMIMENVLRAGTE